MKRNVEVEQKKGICSGNTLRLGGEVSIPRNGKKNAVVRGTIYLIYLKIHLRKDTECCNRRANVAI